MSDGDYGDLLDLQARLESLVVESDKRLVPVIGSGISNSVLPNAEEITRLFRDAIPPSGRARFDSTIQEIIGTPLGYQNGASLLKRQAGDPALARVIRRAVLRACTSVRDEEAAPIARKAEQCRALEQEGEWNVPKGYRDLARFYAGLNGRLRGPIVTTNFDPLIEIALRSNDLVASPIPIPFDQVPSKEQLREYPGTPVLHVHGYWTSDSTLSTIPQLTKPRPELDGLLRSLVENSVVLVMAYGGWEDSFMRSLAKRVEESDLLQFELLWAAYGSDPARVVDNPTLERLNGVPGFNLYLGIDGSHLFDAPAIAPSPPGETPSPFGYELLPARMDAAGYDPRRFVEGQHPAWEDALPGQWPRLNATETLEIRLRAWLDRGGGGGTVAIGPMGEGKSLALRQVAHRIATESNGWTVLWREPGAPRITAEWLREVRARESRVLVCVDEGDLVASDLVMTRANWQSPDSGVAFLLASHDRLWQTRGVHLAEFIDAVPFSGLSDLDAERIASAWAQNDSLPRGVGADSGAAEVVARRLRESSQALLDGAEATLFGAILDVRHGDGLGERVDDLVEKLSRVLVRPESNVTIGDVFGGICLIQDAVDQDGGLANGASRPVIAMMVGLPGVFADGKILQLLGREAAISFSGGRVYSRHPAIARATLRCLRRTGRSVRIAEMVGQAGGRLRVGSGLEYAEYRNAYLIARELPVREEAMAAAVGAIKGARSVLEPRVTLMSVKRKFDVTEARRYAEGIAPHLGEYTDLGGAIRAYLNEFSVIARGSSEPYLSLGLAGLALHDGIGFTLDRKRASYILTSLVKSAQMLSAQSKRSPAELGPACWVLLERIAGSNAGREYLRGIRLDGDAISRFKAMSSNEICSRLGPMLSPPVRAAVDQVSPAVEHDGTLKLSDLRRLASESPGAGLYL